MTWTQIFKKHYFAISDKSKKKWTMTLYGTFVESISIEKNDKFHPNMT